MTFQKMCDFESLTQTLKEFEDHIKQTEAEDIKKLKITKITMVPRLGHAPDIKIHFVGSSAPEHSMWNRVRKKPAQRMMDVVQDEYYTEFIEFGAFKDNKCYVVVRPKFD